MLHNKVVVKLQDGSTMKGEMYDFSPHKKYLHVHTEEERDIEIDVDKIKAVFFVKRYTGNERHQDVYYDEMAGSGEMINVTFKDGETISGYSNAYSPESSAFMLVPADRRSNNERIFIVRSATEEVVRPHLSE